MSAHRMHALDIPARPAPPQSREIREGEGALREILFVLVAVAVAVAVALVVILPLTLGMKTEAPPMQRAAIVATPLVPAEQLQAQRIAIDRLRDWRAGYEAAVENGCQLRPILTAPIQRTP